MKNILIFTKLAVASVTFSAATCVHAHGVVLDSIEVLTPTDGGLAREVSIRLKDSHGKPVSPAELTLTADMPSMPMAHRLPSVSARAGGAPGGYLAKLPFEMRGEWAIKIEVFKPLPAVIVRKVQVK